MITLVIGSLNPAKIEAISEAFSLVYFPKRTGFFYEIYDGLVNIFKPKSFTIYSYDAESGVSAQPMSEEETLRGAKNRIWDCKKHYPDADYWVSVESGIVDNGVTMEEIGYVVVSSGETSRLSHAQLSRIEVPTNMAREIRNGLELSSAIDKVTGQKNSKFRGGLAGNLTDNMIDRKFLIHVAATLAFFSHKKNYLYETANENDQRPTTLVSAYIGAN